MPGVYGQDAGSTCTHVEHIMTITSLRSCYDAIECMKNEETLIVTLDVLGSDSERIRCQDMLAGAAFTLGCSVRNLQSVGVPEQPECDRVGKCYQRDEHGIQSIYRLHACGGRSVQRLRRILSPEPEQCKEEQLSMS